jgi:hypothetical protein
VTVFPVIALAASLACTTVAFARYRRSGSTHELVWTAAFALFVLGAACEVAGSRWGWNPFLARLYYFSGATLVVGYLALGTLFLLAPRRVASVALTAMLLASGLAGFLVAATPVDPEVLPVAGWTALQKGPALVALTLTLNVGGTIVVVGGALLSAWRALPRRGARRPGWQRRLAATLLIAFGALVVASGGTLTRLGHHSYLYLAMAPGVCLLLAGYLTADWRGWPRLRWPLRRARPRLADAERAS